MKVAMNDPVVVQGALQVYKGIGRDPSRQSLLVQILNSILQVR